MVLYSKTLQKYNSNGKDYTAFLAQAPKLKGWDVYSWYQYYNAMAQACANNRCWLIPYINGC